MVTVCTFCGSAEGNDPVYVDVARTLGRIFVDQGWTLVYGGGNSGIMGALASAVAQSGGSVHGIIPEALLKYERGGRNGQSKTNSEEESEFGKVTVVNDMHSRKHLMGKLSDAFIVLPGGFGTAEEMLEVITWSQLGIHSKPIIVVNTNGFFTPMFEWFDRCVKDGFVQAGNRSIVIDVASPEDVPAALKDYHLPQARYDLDWSVQSPLK